ncbi:MAG: CHAP domain-containing protein [Oscillospiraceae bacterium]|nr:CHAP domain-containing protein [Oscillospiraceae bacterium]
MNDIKTKESVVGNSIKVLDKSANLSDRMKDSYIRTKQSAEHSYYAEEDYPEEYASDKVTETSEAIGYEAAYQFDEHGRKGFETTKENIIKAKEHFEHGNYSRAHSASYGSGTKENRRYTGGPSHKRQYNSPKSNPQEQAREYAVKQAKKRTERVYEQRTAESIGNTIRTKESAEVSANITKNGIKTKSSVASASKTAVKGAKSTIKTAEQTSKVCIKTADKTARATVTTTKTAARAPSAIIQGTKKTVNAIYTAGKAVFVAGKSMVKGIIAATKALVAAIAAGGWVAVMIIVIIMLIGLLVGSSFGIFFSNEDTGGETMQEVIRKINDEYLAEIEKIKLENPYDVLEMSGSRAVWKEVLAVYAVKTTTDPINGQEVATITDEKKEILREIFWEMNEISFRTEEITETVIVESDDGNGNIVETETTETRTYLFITVSHKTTNEMAEEYNFDRKQKEQLDALLSEENDELWAMVLYGIAGQSDDMIVAVAQSQIGNVGGEPYWSWYGFSERVDWCACFVSWCANECGYIENGIIPKFASCAIGVNWFKSRGQWVDGSAEPVPGMIIFFDWDEDITGQDGRPNHVGIVEKVENGIIYTIEGNSDDACRRRSYSIGHYEIFGYGVPEY